MILTAEYVSNGHPDRLADSIVNNIVNYVVLKDEDALCGLECAVHTNKVFVDGRIAAGKEKTVINNEIIKDIVKDTYKKAGYGKHYFKEKGFSLEWHPYPDELEIILDICIETLSNEERQLRKYSDDQNVVLGYAVNIKDTNYLPVEHFAAISLGEKFKEMCINIGNKQDGRIFGFGPDFKILVQLKKEQNKYEWERLTLSVEHNKGSIFQDNYKFAWNNIQIILKELFKDTILDTLSTIDYDKFYLNGAGDFYQGGPLGDNGLSGKKLCIDFYGPMIPIGGGAIYGKDPHKVDVCGAIIAREVALKLVKEYNYYSVLVTLAWSPGEEEPYIIQTWETDEFGTRTPIDNILLPPSDYFSIECINKHLHLERRKITSIKDIK